MNWVLSNQRTGIKLTIGKLPCRAQKCIYFEGEGVITPIAYIHKNREKEVERLWALLTEGIPSKALESE
jgi:hypothetical protein